MLPFRSRFSRLFPGLLLCACLVGALAAAPLQALSRTDRPPRLQAESAVLVEAQTGTVLFGTNLDARIPPASLTKLMTLHIALEQIAAGNLALAQVIQPGPDAWAENMPPHSSLMFLGPRQRLTVDQLLTGLVVDSGNDAAVAVAELVAGSVPAFVRMMNDEAARLGYEAMRFVEPSGYSAENIITAREYVDFCRRFIALHPESLRKYFSLRQFTYPLPENLLEGNREKPITQTNRNELLGRFDGADGLKTGYIDESGYNIAATAARDGMRLIAVLLGVPGDTPASGSALRARESAALLSYGFDTFVTARPSFDPPEPVRVWKGRDRTVDIAPRADPVVVVPRDSVRGLHATVEAKTDALAPVRPGQVLGALVVTASDDEVIARFPLVAQTAVARGGVARRAVDSVAIFFRGLFGAPVRF